jgi:Raf kinase inhibitor-like YbhB/YbcL family protein
MVRREGCSTSAAGGRPRTRAGLRLDGRPRTRAGLRPLARRRPLVRLRLPVTTLLALLLAGLVAACAGCGESASSSASSSASAPPPRVAAAATVSSDRSTASVDAVAFVDGKPIAKSSYEHWLTVEQAFGSANAAHRALGFLVSAAWLLDEAAAQHVSVPTAQAKQRLSQLERKSFPQAGSLHRYLERSRETEGDLLERVKLELLEARLAPRAVPGQSAAQRKAALARFQQAFQRRWKSRTTCDAGYVMEDCSEYRGKPEGLSAPSAAAHTARAGASHSSAGASANPSGEVYSAPGAMAMGSPAFERNGTIPAQYTCDGADISPPLEWQNVPAKAAALVLFVIDDTATGPASAIRWVVGDIDPNTQGVAAGKTPEGGIVGSDTQGHVGYGGICPARGKTSTVEFVLYALSKKIALSPGFAATTAESEYGSGNDLLGQSAVTYAVYHRP